jgi:DNA-binding SARP family transcriptional activator/predicted ATPase
LVVAGGEVAELCITLFGPLQVTLDGEPASFESDKVRALLAYLVVESEGPHRRERLAGLLWPDWPETSARNNLRHTLAVLRRTIGDHEAEPPYLHVTRQEIRFNASSEAQADVIAFSALLQSSQPAGPQTVEALAHAVELYQGDFLQDFSLPDSPEFEEWALLTREQFRREAMEALHRLAGIQADRGEYQAALEYARRQTELDPWREEAHAQVMRALALSGRRSEALAQYQTCRRLLAEELGVEPAAHTRRLYEQIRAGQLQAAGPAPAPPARLPPFLEEEPPPLERPVFVARDRELGQLERFLDRAVAGRGQVVFVTGEAGSGKTALVQEFGQRALAAGPAADPRLSLVVASGNCNAYTGLGDPYLPFREILELLTGDVQARWAAGAMTQEHARRLWNMLPLAVQALEEAGPDLVDTFVHRGPLLARARASAPARVDWLDRLDAFLDRKASAPGEVRPQQSDLFEQYTKLLQTLAQERPLLLVLDDLQWADLGSISLLFHLGRQLAGSRILVVGAYRPEEVAAGREGERHPLEPVIHEFRRYFGDITVHLGQAGSWDFVDALLDSEPNRLDRSFREMLYRQTRGHPLFTVELLRGLQERGDLVQDAEGHWVQGSALDWQMLPARVEAVIAERIGRLPEALPRALAVASVEGEDFTAEVVARALGTDERKMVQRLSIELDQKHRLVRVQAIEHVGPRRVSRYRFRNYLFQKYLYDNLGPADRAYLHEDVGIALEDLYGGGASTGAGAPAAAAVAVQLAWHFQEAGIVDKAIDYLRQAGERAVQLSAYQEGIAHLSRGLELLLAQPESLERAERELTLQLSLGMAWMGTSALEVEKAYVRARELCQQTGKRSPLCRILGHLSSMHYVRADHHRARELVEEALHLAQQAGDPLVVAQDHWRLGFVLVALGEYATAQRHLQQTTDFYEPQHHAPLVFLAGADAGVSALAYSACCLWTLGYPEQAQAQSREARDQARALEHPFTMADVLAFGGCMFHWLLRDGQTLKDCADALVRLATERKMPTWLAIGTCYQGAALVWLGQVQEGTALIQEGIAACWSDNVLVCLPGAMASLAEAQAIAGQPEDGLVTLAEALSRVEQTDERHWEAEIRRLRAELLLVQGDEPGAEASYQNAIEVARHQQARSWELRSATGLARLWQRQGKEEEALGLLAGIYGWFSEGFDTPDLKEARALLEELS